MADGGVLLMLANPIAAIAENMMSCIMFMNSSMLKIMYYEKLKPLHLHQVHATA